MRTALHCSALLYIEIEISRKYLEILWLSENVKCGNVKSAMLSVKTLFGPVQ